MTAVLSTKERNVQRSATITGFRMALMPMLQARLATESLESALKDTLIGNMLKQAEDMTGYAIRISVSADGQLEWLQNDLTEDTMSNVQMSNKQVMRATLGGVQLEVTIAQKSDKGTDVVDRDAVVYAAQRFIDVLTKLPSATLHVPALESGKRYVWDLQSVNADNGSSLDHAETELDAVHHSADATDTQTHGTVDDDANLADSLHQHATEQLEQDIA